MISEAGLMTSIRSDSVLTCIDAYSWDNRVWMILPYLDKGKITDVLLEKWEKRRTADLFSEEACKYLLYRIC